MGCIRTLKDQSTTLLDTSETYTSPGFKTELYNQVRGLVSSDQGGSLKFEESVDGATWHQTATTSVTGSADSATPFAFTCHAYWARVVYENGTTPQTSFDIQVYVDPFE